MPWSLDGPEDRKKASRMLGAPSAIAIVAVAGHEWDKKKRSD